MESYYKILGIDERASKPLIKMAYVYAISYAREKQIENSGLRDIHLAYQLLKNYRIKHRKYIKKGMKDKADKLLKEQSLFTKKQIANGRIDTLIYTSKTSLEFGYCVRTMLLGIIPMLFYIFTEMMVDFLTLTKDARDFFASLIFYVAAINLFTQWVESYYSFLLILTAFGLVLWHLKFLEKKVIKAIDRHLNKLNTSAQSG